MASPGVDTSDLTATPPDATTQAPDMSDLTTTAPSAPASSEPATPPAPGRGLMSNIVGGMLKGASKKVEGGMNLLGEGVEKLTGMPAGSLQATRKETEAPSIARDLGEGVENVGEFAAGDAALEGAAKMSKIAQHFPEVLTLMEKYPKASKILLGTAKAATTGAAQGAVEGAAEGNAKQGAIKGAEGGALGGAVGETAGVIAQELGKGVGIGTTAAEDSTRGIKPNKRNLRFAEDFQRSAPYMDAENSANKAKSVEDWADHTDEARRKLYTDRIKKDFIDPHANVPLSGISIRDGISNQIPNTMKKFNPTGAADVERLANEFMPGQQFALNVGDAEDSLEHFNAELAATGYWSKLPNERAALLRTDPKILGYKAAADAIREELYGRLGVLEPNQVKTIDELKKDYGALRNVGNEIRGQVNVAGRQAPLSLKQTIGMVTGLAAGTPLGAAAAAVPMIDKMVNSPEKLIARGVQKAARPGEEGVISKVAKDVGESARTAAAPAAGAAAGEDVAHSQNRIMFRASDGTTHSVPADQIVAARAVDPHLVIVNQ